MDVRGDGGYAVTCGCSAKGRYEPWFDRRRAIAFEDLPAELQEALSTPKRSSDGSCSKGMARRALTSLWKDEGFNFEETCRSEGRNNAVALLALRSLARGNLDWMERHAEMIVDKANKATDGLNKHGEPEEYTRREYDATLASVSRYTRIQGLWRALKRAQDRLKRLAPRMPREWQQIIRVLLLAAFKSSRSTFAHALRTIAKEAELSWEQFRNLRYKNRRREWDKYVGEFFSFVGTKDDGPPSSLWHFRFVKEEKAGPLDLSWLNLYRQNTIAFFVLFAYCSVG